MKSEALLIFAKNAEAGKVKTRLAATIGNEAALSVYQQLLACTAAASHDVPAEKFVFYSDFIPQEDVWDHKLYRKALQQGIDLGERMKNAFAAAFEKGFIRLLIIGTDCPDISAELILDAFNHLQRNDIVIGPAADGGYYLLGMNKMHGELFEGIAWSTGNVLRETIGKCEDAFLSCYLLPVLHDVDEEKDLQALK